uniref:Ig-like domain-containing protein n=1 Tax=Dicentrarchus labrax TaxID=13489 RepID=A0A8C4DLQ9_DICLA
MKFLLLLMCLCLTDDANSQLICSRQPITALAGDDVILPCHLEPPISVSDETVEWTRPDLDPKYIHVHQDGRLMFDYQNPSYYLRTRLFMDELMTGNVSMKIYKVKVSDTGRYQCALPSLQKEASIQLIVGQSDVIGSDKPVTVTVGDNAILPCHLEPAFNVRSLLVEWKHNGKYVLVTRHGKDYLDPQDENFRGRTSVFHEEMIRGNISLKLTNVTELDAGSYTCFVPGLQSQVRRGFINLTVEPVENGNKESQTDDINTEPGGDTGNTTGAITGIAIGVIAVIAVIAGIVALAVLWMKRRNRRQEREYRPVRMDNDAVTIPMPNINTRGQGANAGASDGANVGANMGASDGASDGANVGANMGASDGANAGANAGTSDGANVGANMGASDGANVGANMGASDEANAGANAGTSDGVNAGANMGGQ